MSAIIIDGNLVHYETTGRGRPVLFLHGWLGSWRYWMQTMEELSFGWRSYAFDFWGFGDSDRVQDRYHLNDLVRQLDGFLDDLGIWRISLVGHGLGAVAAVQFASLFPQRVERLMAISLPLSRSMVDQKAMQPGGGVLGMFSYRWNEYPEIAGELRKTDLPAIPRTINSMATFDLPQSLSVLDMPVLLVYGRKDPIITSLSENLLNPERYNTRLISFNAARHFPMLEERGKFSRLIKGFFEAGDDLRDLELKEEWRRRTR
jgi:pimeloyl-ACP methyl ester carboxylesterase